MTAPPRPGAVPCWPMRIDATEETKRAWEEYCWESSRYWQWVADEVTKHVPGYGLEYIGGGSVITVIYEDRSYAWLGGLAEDDGDGPYAFGPPSFVGGYRYDSETCGETFTDRHVVPVTWPDDADDVVQTIVKVARELWTMPFTQEV
jgi:hypothetical protein